MIPREERRRAGGRTTWLAVTVILLAGCGSGPSASPVGAPPASPAVSAAPSGTVGATVPSPTPVATPAPSPGLVSTPIATAIPVADSSPTPTAGTTPSACVSPGTHTVVAGDTLWEIAQDHCVTLDVLLAANPQILDRSLIRPGDRIVIAGPLVAIVDSLGAATPAVTFETPGSWGDTIFDQQNAGPMFSLADPTLVTEIGGFLSYIRPPLRPPLRVEIRPTVDGVPDVSTVLATFELPISGTEPTVSYVAVTPGVVLPPGTYFAMFAPQAGDVGSLLGGASVPFEYRAGSTPMGYLNAIEGTSSASPGMYVAVRILGRALLP